MVAGDLFGRGIQALFRNYLVGREVGIGIAALADDQRFLRAVRRFADTVYAEALATTGASRIVDVSPGNERVAAVIRAVYPDAFEYDPGNEPAAPASSPIYRLQARPIFVVGVPRSGTTWLEHLLLAHPSVRGPARETSTFMSLRALHDNIGRPASEGVAAWIDRKPFVAALRAFAEGLFADYLARAGAPGARFLEKTPMHAEHLALMAELFPEASIISIHRDGRDVVRSLLAMEAAVDDPDVAASRWAEITARVAAAVPSLPHACDIRYEDLVADPVGKASELMAWLGLSVDDVVLEELSRRSTERVSQYNDQREPLTRRERRSVYRHAGDQLLELGYITPEELRSGRRRWLR